jgi:hypothetical protein
MPTKFWLENLKEKIPLSRTKRRWENNMKVDHWENIVEVFG